jgi:3-ketosteroid 9alpha-monooxygenase subunit A
MADRRYAYLEPGHFARGWHIVRFSQELGAGEAIPLRYFNRDFVLYRGESGQAAILDAFCPHLGAHLASGGGRVIGDNIACPFHGWTFAADGRCVDIPYAGKIPERAETALRGWPVLEKNGFIALWYDPEGNPPEDYLPAIPVWGAGQDDEEGWGDWQFQRSRIRAQPCDVIENIVDIAHFPFVHGGRVKSFENRFGERTVTQISRVQSHPEAQMVIPPGLPFDIMAARQQSASYEADAWGDATYHGPSIMYYYTESRSETMSYQSWWVNYHTPVNDEELDLCSAVIVNSLTDDPLPEEFRALYPQSAHAAFGSDVEIWKDKVYREDPILCDGDGPINKLRRWYEQFYLPLP